MGWFGVGGQLGWFGVGGQLGGFGVFSAGWVGLGCYSVKYSSRGASLVVLQCNSEKVLNLWCLPCRKFSLLCVVPLHLPCHSPPACHLVPFVGSYEPNDSWSLKKLILVCYKKSLTELVALAVYGINCKRQRYQ